MGDDDRRRELDYEKIRETFQDRKPRRLPINDYSDNDVDHHVERSAAAKSRKATAIFESKWRHGSRHKSYENAWHASSSISHARLRQRRSSVSELDPGRVVEHGKQQQETYSMRLFVDPDRKGIGTADREAELLFWGEMLESEELLARGMKKLANALRPSNALEDVIIARTLSRIWSDMKDQIRLPNTSLPTTQRVNSGYKSPLCGWGLEEPPPYVSFVLETLGKIQDSVAKHKTGLFHVQSDVQPLTYWEETERWMTAMLEWARQDPESAFLESNYNYNDHLDPAIIEARVRESFVDGMQALVVAEDELAYRLQGFLPERAYGLQNDDLLKWDDPGFAREVQSWLLVQIKKTTEDILAAFSTEPRPMRFGGRREMQNNQGK